ncbi:MAG: carbamoyl-phosphate synthase large subunit, partial [Candidatus Gastranaerophilales bacterium]|nr:carbamoyl-phosphate synthase large subunit [Candidatus Gastranaerophilales bacterium]
KDELMKRLEICDDERIFVVAEALRKGISVKRINKITKIDKWFVKKIANIVEIENRLQTEPMNIDLLKKAESMGFTDVEIQELSKESIETLDTLRRAHNLYPVYKMVDTCAAEFESSTPYYYSSFDQEEENVISKKEKIIVLGSGPIRIGQGIEFDYCSVHATWAIRDAGYESIIINNNPETVSTDFDTSDKLYFEPLYIEDVFNVIRKEMPKGVIVQFGGQTAINLAPKLLKRGVQILGTSVESINVAEDRNLFERLLTELHIPQPRGAAVTTLKDAVITANNIGYPVLVRPSYVIGGRAMQVVNNDDELKGYVKEAVALSTEHPILVDQYIEGTEVEVDAIADGEDILIPGIMEHIERTGVHSGDSFCSYPSRTLSKAVIDKLVEYTQRLAKALQVSGLMNIQYVVKNDDVYVIEVNPRASRTVPIMSKVTGVPMVKLAIQVVIGEKLKNLGYGTGLLPWNGLFAVKAPVFSFQKLTNVDTALTPEMKSTGEVLGVDFEYDKALVKAFLGAGYTFPEKGNILISVKKANKEETLSIVREFQELGFGIIATQLTSNFLREQGINPVEIDKFDTDLIHEKIKNKEINLVLNTPTIGKDVRRCGFKLRTYAEQYKVPCFTSLDTVKAYLLALKTFKKEKSFTYDELKSYIKAPVGV